MINFFAGDSPERKVDRLIAQGERLFQHGKEREGIDKFAEAAQILPEASKPSLYLGRAYFKRQEYDLALKHYYKGLYFCEITEEPGILCEIAQVYLRMKRYDIAEEKLHKALRLEEYFALSIKGLIHIYLSTGRISDAVEQQKILRQHHPDDIQVIQKLVESHRLLGEYHQARVLLQKVLETTHSGWNPDRTDIELQVRELNFPDGIELGIKEHLYAKYGNICLGTSGDNGLKLSLGSIQELTSSSLQFTLKRFADIVRTFSWNITCVVACEKSSLLLASIIAELLNIPVKSVPKITKSDCALVCQLHLKESKPIKKLLKKLGRRTHSVITFAFISTVDDEENSYIPDIIGIPVEKSAKISWKNANELVSHSYHETQFFGTSSTSSEDVIQQFLDELYAIPEEDNIQQQTAYYLRENSLLREHLVPLPPPSQCSNSSSNFSTEAIVNKLLSEQKSEMYAMLRHLRNNDLNIPEILSTLKTMYVEHQESGVRRIIGKLLLYAEHEEGFGYLLSLFYESDTDVALKTTLVETLCQSSNRKVADVVYSALQDSDEAVRACASKYLEKLDYSHPLSELHATLLADIPIIIVRTIRYLNAHQSQLLYDFLPNLLQHYSTEVIHEALHVLQERGEHRYTSAVLKLLSHHEQHIIAHAILAIGRIGGIDCGHHLLPFLEHENPELRYAAAASLTKLERQRSIVFLMERLRKESLDVQEKLLKLLGEVGLQETIPFIVQFAEQHLESPDIVSAAMRTLALLKNPRSLPFVRKAAAKFPNEEILSYYISIAAVIGDEKDTENLITFLEHPPTIQYRVAALLYRKGFKRYFHVLQDGIRSKRLPINLLAIEVLAEIGDEASVQVIFSAFGKEIPELDRKITAEIFRHSETEEYVRLFRKMPSTDSEVIIRGIHRAIQTSCSLEDVIHNIEVLYMFLANGAIPDIQAFISQKNSSPVQCGAMKWLAQHDQVNSQSIIQNNLNSENIDVANMAYILVGKLQSSGVVL